MSPVQRPTRGQVRIFLSAEAFRAWLDEHHATASELFVGFYRAGAGKAAMTYAESVDEALCYGWIDGITYRIDDEVRATRFTPRRRTSNWSAVNLAKVEQLRAAGRMRPAGIRAHAERDRRKDATYSHERPEVSLDAGMLRRFRADAGGWAYWQARPPSFRRQASYWVMSAKRPETRERRFGELLASASAGRPPGPFLVSREAREGSAR
jgi:uncharacterized protein YdeI (YjbR/CyaY-like superfamily)